MPPLPPVQAVRVSFEGSYATSHWANVMHVLYTGGAPSGGTMIAFATSMYGYYAARFLPLLDQNVVLQSCLAIDLSSSSGHGGIASGSSTGALTGTPMLASAAYGISWHVDRRYRGGHSRTYLIGCEESAIATGTLSRITTSQINALTTAAGNFIADVVTNADLTGPGLCVVSYRSGNAARVTPITELITSARVHPRFDTQRRRLGKEV